MSLPSEILWQIAIKLDNKSLVNLCLASKRCYYIMELELNKRKKQVLETVMSSLMFSIKLKNPELITYYSNKYGKYNKFSTPKINYDDILMYSIKSGNSEVFKWFPDY